MNQTIPTHSVVIEQAIASIQALENINHSLFPLFGTFAFICLILALFFFIKNKKIHAKYSLLSGIVSLTPSLIIGIVWCVLCFQPTLAKSATYHSHKEKALLILWALKKISDQDKFYEVDRNNTIYSKEVILQGLKKAGVPYTPYLQNYSENIFEGNNPHYNPFTSFIALERNADLVTVIHEHIHEAGFAKEDEAEALTIYCLLQSKNRQDKQLAYEHILYGLTRDEIFLEFDKMNIDPKKIRNVHDNKGHTELSYFDKEERIKREKIIQIIIAKYIKSHKEKIIPEELNFNTKIFAFFKDMPDNFIIILLNSKYELFKNIIQLVSRQDMENIYEEGPWRLVENNLLPDFTEQDKENLEQYFKKKQLISFLNKRSHAKIVANIPSHLRVRRKSWNQ